MHHSKLESLSYELYDLFVVFVGLPTTLSLLLLSAAGLLKILILLNSLIFRFKIATKYQHS